MKCGAVKCSAFHLNKVLYSIGWCGILLSLLYDNSKTRKLGDYIAT